jgi:hypothetical protein
MPRRLMISGPVPTRLWGGSRREESSSLFKLLLMADTHHSQNCSRHTVHLSMALLLGRLLLVKLPRALELPHRMVAV